MEQRYQDYSRYLQKKYGDKVYKLPINLPGTCPNRDGTVGEGGCTFCDSQGAGFEALPNTMEIKEQIQKNKEFFKVRFNAKKFISYFQAYTNTYMGLEKFKEIVEAATEDPDLVGLSVSTRPDCINDEYLDMLLELKNRRNFQIDIELGLQTVNYQNLVNINRGHTLAEYIDAVLRIKRYGFNCTTHVILNLPGDNMIDIVECAKIISALGVDYVKLHSLYIVKGTKLADSYENGEFEVISLDEYVDRVVAFMEHLNPDIIIQRLVGKGPQGNLLFCNWDTSWWKIKAQIESTLEERDTYQGKKFNYLNGRALHNKF